jgi:glycine cleavage system aminomethyltransferase T
MSEVLPNPLRERHVEAGAEFQPYAALEIVGTFGQPEAEYAAIRKSAGLMDLPQRSVLELTGKDRHAFLNNLLTNQTWDKTSKTGMAAGTGVYAYYLNLKGRIVVDMNVLEVGERTLLEMDVRMVEVVRAAFDKYLFAEQVTMSSMVGRVNRLAIHGPEAASVLADAAGGGDAGARGVGVGDPLVVRGGADRVSG